MGLLDKLSSSSRKDDSTVDDNQQTDKHHHYNTGTGAVSQHEQHHGTSATEGSYQNHPSHSHDGPAHSTGSSIQHPIGPGSQGSGITGGLYKDGMPINADQTGGVSSRMNDLSLKSGPHSQMENYEAVPTAGGHKVGGLGEISTSHRGDSTTGSNTGPASSTIGPHSSNVANIVDPRVHPDPALQGSTQRHAAETGPASKTIGPHDSNVANVLDPRVGPNPDLQGSARTSDHGNNPRTQGNEHHYGRDAAFATGGVGAGAAGLHAEQQHKKHGTHHHNDHHDHTTSSTAQSGASKDLGLDHRSHDTTTASKSSNSAPYGQNVSYMNRPAADEPLSHSTDFAQRHPAATTGAGVGAASGIAGTEGLLHHEHDKSGVTGASSAGAHHHVGGSGATSAPAAGSPQISKQLASAYEAGYQAGFRDGSGQL